MRISRCHKMCHRAVSCTREGLRGFRTSRIPNRLVFPGLVDTILVFVLSSAADLDVDSVATAMCNQ